MTILNLLNFCNHVSVVDWVFLRTGFFPGHLYWDVQVEVGKQILQQDLLLCRQRRKSGLLQIVLLQNYVC